MYNRIFKGILKSLLSDGQHQQIPMVHFTMLQVYIMGGGEPRTFLGLKNFLAIRHGDMLFLALAVDHRL